MTAISSSPAGRWKVFLAAILLWSGSPGSLFSQSAPGDMNEIGILAGGFTNFPANRHYLEEDINFVYAAPYLRTGHHEFSAGLLYPLPAKGLYLANDRLSSRPGFVGSYKFTVFDVYARENLFLHYAFEYVTFSGKAAVVQPGTGLTETKTEKDRYFNHAIGLGYSLFFDRDGRFGLYYLLDYVISQTRYSVDAPSLPEGLKSSRTFWDHVGTQIGLSFKIVPLKKKTASSGNH
ncbi:MAG TPA: hypothetical protein PKG48_08140 [Bacteroidales bacterium]|nr:hypothetical protein [Bacteroidales bacterium]